jgi:outer membrane scaffolding protein for murein synthesis (MipA/OmpV family)
MDRGRIYCHQVGLLSSYDNKVRTKPLVSLHSTRRLVFGTKSQASFNATGSTDANMDTQWHADGVQAGHSDADTMNPQRVKRSGQVVQDGW